MRGIFWILVVLVLGIAVFISISYFGASGGISSFDECVAAGNPVMKSYPAQCRTSDGRIFVENVGTEIEMENVIRVGSPRPNEAVSSPLTITGTARGTWYFEASFPIRLYDANGRELGVAVAEAQGDPATGEVNWMTEDFVPFKATLTFNEPTTETGMLVFEKDNPSGLPQFDAKHSIPVRFAPRQVMKI